MFSGANRGGRGRHANSACPSLVACMAHVRRHGSVSVRMAGWAVNVTKVILIPPFITPAGLVVWVNQLNVYTWLGGIYCRRSINDPVARTKVEKKIETDNSEGEKERSFLTKQQHKKALCVTYWGTLKSNHRDADYTGRIKVSSAALVPLSKAFIIY